jgi:ATP-dependent Clp protease adapter protein ClpS
MTQWATMVRYDPLALDLYLLWTLRCVFGLSDGRAAALTRRIRVDGAAEVSRGAREPMERDATTLLSYGLLVTVERR